MTSAESLPHGLRRGPGERRNGVSEEPRSSPQPKSREEPRERGGAALEYHPPAMSDVVTMDKIVGLCKRRGFVFPSSEIYGGVGSTYDYGHYGVLLKNNVKNAWWRAMLQERDDIVAIDSAILQHPRVWEASGHLAGFTDPLVDCRTCKQRFRADHLAELPCGRKPSKHPGETDECDLTDAREFNLMFETTIGPVKESGATAYLRPETAQGIFINFKNVLQFSAQEAPVRDRAGGQVVSQRDHSGELHLPHAGVRADGDGVLRSPRGRPELVRALALRAGALVRGARTAPRPPAPASARAGRAVALLERHQRRGVPVPHRPAGRSSRGSPTAATSISPSTRSTPERSSSTSIRAAGSATCRT